MKKEYDYKAGERFIQNGIIALCVLMGIKIVLFIAMVIVVLVRSC